MVNIVPANHQDSVVKWWFCCRFSCSRTRLDVTTHLLDQSWSTATETFVKRAEIRGNKTQVPVVEMRLLVVFLIFPLITNHVTAGLLFLHMAGIVWLRNWAFNLNKDKRRLFPGHVLCFGASRCFSLNLSLTAEFFLSLVQCSATTCRHSLMWLLGLFCMSFG